LIAAGFDNARSVAKASVHDLCQVDGVSGKKATAFIEAAQALIG